VIVFPSSVEPQAQAAESAARQAVTTVNALASSPDVQSYQAATQNPSFQSTLNSVDSTYNDLIGALTG